MIISGVHGKELAAIQVVFELKDELKETDNLAGEVTIIPIVNLPAVLAQKRESPIDYKNLNGIYPRTSDEGGTFSNILRFNIEKLAKEHDFLIDVHSSSRGTFIPYAAPPTDSKSNIDLACEFGSELILIREQTGMSNSAREKIIEEGAKNIAAAVSAKSKTLGFSFEVGSGTIIASLYVKAAKDMVQRFLSHIGTLTQYKSKYHLSKTPNNRVFHIKDTVKAYAPCYGDLFFYKGVGKIFHKNEPIGYILNFTTLEKEELRAPINGQLFYRRYEPRIKPETADSTTVAAFIPTTKIHNEFIYSRLAREQSK